MNKSDFESLCDLRAKEAKALLDSGHYPGAYYLFGYAIECALKACVAKRVKAHDFPDKKFADKCWTHDLQQLVSLAGLKDDLDKAIGSDANLGANWSLVKDWSEEARYSAIVPKKRAEELYQAGHNGTNGVLQWIKKHW